MKYLIIIISVLIIAMGLSACGGTTTTIIKTLPPTDVPTDTSTPTGMPQYRPIEVVSVLIPGATLVNPGGPTVEITLKNNAAEPVISLNATLELQRSYEFDFGVTESSPLAAGASTSKT